MLGTQQPFAVGTPLWRPRALTLGALAGVALLGSALVACGSAEESRAGTDSVTGSMAEPASPSGATDLMPSLADTNKQGAPTEALRSASGEAQGGARSAAAPAAPATGGTSGQPAPAAEPAMPSLDFLGRSIIRTGTLDLQVESVSDAFERVSSIATGAGGFVAESRFFGRQGDPTIPPRTAVDERTQTTAAPVRPPQGGASLTLRIPANRFDDVVSQLRGVAVEVRSISTGSQDVTGDVTDLESTLRNLRAVEARYIEMLSTAHTTADILQIQDRLNQTRAQIERADGRLAGLRRLADMSTLTISLAPTVPQQSTTRPSAFAPVADAWDASLDALRALGLGILVAAAFGWWMLPLGALAVWGAVRLLRTPAVARSRSTRLTRRRPRPSVEPMRSDLQRATPRWS